MRLPGLPWSRSSRSVVNPLSKRVWSAGRILILMIGLSATFGTFFLTGMRVANKAREVKVPDVSGRSVADAKRALTAVGLVLKVEMHRADAKIPADHVISQDPSAGSVLRRDRAIRVRVSDGQQDPVLPSVVGQLERSADIALAQDAVQVGVRAEIRTAAYPAGTVVAQDPPAKNRAGTIALLVNRGETGESYVMPDVIGTIGSRVVEVLRRRGFRVTIAAEVPYPGLPPGVVVRQTPRAGFQIAEGESVALEVSR